MFLIHGDDCLEEIDIGNEAPTIRSSHLKTWGLYFRLRAKKVKWIFVAEALGYQGGRFSENGNDFRKNLIRLFQINKSIKCAFIIYCKTN